MSEAREPRILLGVTGSIATLKAPELVREFRDRGGDVAVVMTEAAARFVGPLTFETMTGNPVALDLFAPQESRALPGWLAGTEEARLPYHLALANSADVIVVAPVTATTLGKYAGGIADNLLTSCLLATQRPVVLAPAMNTLMWLHPATVANVETLRARGVHVIEPDVGRMAWTEEGRGPGRLPEPRAIAEHVWCVLKQGCELEGVRVVVSAGGTEEPIDAVRVLANRSSGRMGVALAEEARDRGGDVVLVAGRMSVSAPPGVRVVPARTAAEMREAVLAEVRGAGLLLMAAAVADWRPVEPAARKLKRSEGAPTIRLEPTEDILAALKGKGAGVPAGLFRVGFALETEDAVENARRKLAEKDLDLLVVNDTTEPGAGFEVDTNRVTLIAKSGCVEELPLLSKRETAARILDRVAEIRRGE
jgi:phosphopantothenoylcysteine decarboxylase/phosphopantothenate--cysteine ligase